MPDISESIVVQLLTFLLVNGGAGIVGFGIIDFLNKKWEWFSNLDSDYRRYLSLIATLLVGWAAYGLALWLGVYEVPVTSQEWVTMLIAVGGTVFTASQLTHGLVDLRPASRK